MTTEQIHGHEILDLVASHPEGISVPTLFKLATEKFGPDVRFCTCSNEGMDMTSLLTFLFERDKIQLHGDLIVSVGSPACNHDHH